MSDNRILTLRCVTLERRVVALVFLFFFCVSQISAQTEDLVKRLERAAAFIGENQLASAEQELNGILKIAPDESVALNLLGTVRAKQGRLPEAEALFLKSIQGNKSYVGAHMNLAYLYTLMGQPEKGIAELRQVLALEPANSEAVDRLARLLLAHDHLTEGITLLEKAKQAQQISVDLLILRGDAYLKQGDGTRAAESYELALAQKGDSTDAVLGLAQVAQLRGDANSASGYLERARKMQANSPYTLYRFAMIAMRAGLYEEANGTLLAAIKIKSDDASYFLALGTTWIKKPDLVEAERAFRQALKLEPENPKAQMYLGYTLLEQKKYSEAQEWLEKSVKRDQSVPETFFYLGQIAQQLNDDERAIVLFKKAIDLVPSYSFAHAGLGASYLRLKNYPLAQQELELSIKLNPNDPKAHYDLAVLFARLKNQQRAQEEMRIVEKLKSEGKTGSEGVTTPAIRNP